MSETTRRQHKFGRPHSRQGLWLVAAVAVATAAGCASTSSPSAAETPAPSPTSAAPSPTSAAPSPTPAASPTTAEATSSCRQPCADANGWIVEVKNFKYDVSSGNEFITPESGNVFVTMKVTFINHAKSSKSAAAFDFKLKAGGVEQNAELIGPCESWSSVDVSPGASYGPKCLAFQAKAGQSKGIVLIWRPGLVFTYDIPLS